MAVVGTDRGNHLVRPADAAHDRAEGIGEFEADEKQPFLVGLRRGDLQEGDGFASRGQFVADDAVVAEFQELFVLPPAAGAALS